MTEAVAFDDVGLRYTSGDADVFVPICGEYVTAWSRRGGSFVGDGDACYICQERDVAKKELMVELGRIFLGLFVGCSELVTKSFLVFLSMDGFGIRGGYEGLWSFLSISSCGTFCGDVARSFIREA